MIDESDLGDMLEHWRREFGWGGMPRPWGGISPAQSIADFHGKAPAITGFRPQVMLGTIADDVERAVVSLEPANWLVMSVLRCEFLGRQNTPIEARCDRMRDIGMPQSPTTYYRRLVRARELLMDKLNEVVSG